jgi:hypothetical protein
MGNDIRRGGGARGGRESSSGGEPFAGNVSMELVICLPAWV